MEKGVYGWKLQLLDQVQWVVALVPNYFDRIWSTLVDGYTSHVEAVKQHGLNITINGRHSVEHSDVPF